VACCIGVAAIIAGAPSAHGVVTLSQAATQTPCERAVIHSQSVIDATAQLLTLANQSIQNSNALANELAKPAPDQASLTAIRNHAQEINDTPRPDLVALGDLYEGAVTECLWPERSFYKSKPSLR